MHSDQRVAMHSDQRLSMHSDERVVGEEEAHPGLGREDAADGLVQHILRKHALPHKGGQVPAQQPQPGGGGRAARGCARWRQE